MPLSKKRMRERKRFNRLNVKSEPEVTFVKPNYPTELDIDRNPIPVYE